MKYNLAEKANQDRKKYASLKELHVNEFIDAIIEKERNERTTLRHLQNFYPGEVKKSNSWYRT